MEIERPASYLRDASALIRERAKAATAGPWRSDDDDVVTTWVEDNGEAVVICRDAGTDAEHIASWDPTVARAVAALLDRIAQHWETHGFGDDGGLPIPADNPVLAIARAYLPGLVDTQEAPRLRLAEVVRTHGEPPPGRVYGPYSTSGDADADAAELARGVFRTPEDASVGEPQYVALVNACTCAGIDLGVFDERILVWLSHWEASTSTASRSPNGTARRCTATSGTSSPSTPSPPSTPPTSG